MAKNAVWATFVACRKSPEGFQARGLVRKHGRAVRFRTITDGQQRMNECKGPNHMQSLTVSRRLPLNKSHASVRILTISQRSRKQAAHN